MIHFIYGTMATGKTLHLLSSRYNCIQSKIITKTIAISDQRGDKRISSRALNESVEPDELINKDTDLFVLLDSDSSVEVVYIDECQFLTVEQVHQLRAFSTKYPNKDIYCYGLLTTTENDIWEASKELLLLAHVKEELHSRCQCCGKKYATHHVKNPNSDWSDKDGYLAVCFECWNQYKK